MKLTNNLVEKYGVDKILHFFGGGWIVSMFSPIGWLGIILGYIIMLIVSFAKELFFDDSFDKKDILAACFGGGVSVIVYLALSLLI